MIINEEVDKKQKEDFLNTIQNSLDIIGIEPTIGTTADAANTVISLLRSALEKEKDAKKKHLINAGISAVSMIPFADVIKLLKLRKANRKVAVKGARTVKNYSSHQKTGHRFNESVLIRRNH